MVKLAQEVVLAITLLCVLMLIGLLQVVDWMLVGLIKLVSMVPCFLPKSRM